MVHVWNNVHGGTRTHNLPLRRRAPYPLGHANPLVMFDATFYLHITTKALLPSTIHILVCQRPWFSWACYRWASFVSCALDHIDCSLTHPMLGLPLKIVIDKIINFFTWKIIKKFLCILEVKLYCYKSIECVTS